MLRYLVLILFIVNATFLAWSQGWLKPLVGVQPDLQHEPERLRQQQHAERIAVLSGAPSQALAASAVNALSADAAASAASSASAATPSSSPELAASSASLASDTASGGANSSSRVSKADTASTAASASAAPGICLQAGPFRNEDMAEVRNTLQKPLSAEAWTTQAVSVSGIWLVYMGPYPDEDLYAKKLNELRRIKSLSIEEINAPAALAHGLSLGRYGSLSAAQSGLATMKLRGIRTARIVVLRPEAEMQSVRVAQASQRTQVALSALKLPQGKTFSACQP